MDLFKPGTHAARLFDAITQYPCRLTSDEAVMAIYPDPDDEGEWPERVVMTVICLMNRKLRSEGIGLRIYAVAGVYRAVLSRKHPKTSRPTYGRRPPIKHIGSPRECGADHLRVSVSRG